MSFLFKSGSAQYHLDLWRLLSKTKPVQLFLQGLGHLLKSELCAAQDIHDGYSWRHCWSISILVNCTLKSKFSALICDSSSLVSLSPSPIFLNSLVILLNFLQDHSLIFPACQCFQFFWHSPII